MKPNIDIMKSYTHMFATADDVHSQNGDFYLTKMNFILAKIIIAVSPKNNASLTVA